MKTKKQVIRLTEADLHRVIKESVNRVLNERIVDRDGQDYIEDESFPAGGGLDDRCSYNKECVEAFDLVDFEDMEEFLKEKGFKLVSQDNDSEIWQKGDTRVYYDGFVGGSYGYMRTEYITNVKRKRQGAVNKELSRMMTNMLMPPKGYGIKK